MKTACRNLSPPASISEPRAQASGVRTTARLALALVPIALLGCAQPKRNPFADTPFTTEEWSYRGRTGTKLITQHYEICTTLRDDLLVRSLPEINEAAYAEYSKYVPPADSPRDKMRVYLFADRAEWDAFTKEFVGPRAAVFLKVRNGGYSERGVSVIQYVSNAATFPLMAHEGFHQYLHCCVNERVPAWLNEGLAVMFEGQRWGMHGLIAFDAWYNPPRANSLTEALSRNKLFPMRDLLETNAGRVLGASSRTISTYYGQLWGLIWFLREGENGRYAPGFGKLLDVLRANELEKHAQAAAVWDVGDRTSFGEAVFCSFIDDDLDALEKQYQAFLRQKLLNDKPPAAK